MNNENVFNAVERVQAELDKMSFADKIKLVKSMSSVQYKHNFIKYDGYVAEKDTFAVYGGDDEYYVYLWKHLDGDVFYVGSGHGERYRNKHRNVDFLRHIDKGDAVVYRILIGVDSKTARFYEKYLSGSMGLADYILSNGDNNVIHIGADKFNRWLEDNASKLDNELTRKIENAILKVLYDTDFRADHVRSIQTFREECGDAYFSSGGVCTNYQLGDMA